MGMTKMLMAIAAAGLTPPAIAGDTGKSDAKKSDGSKMICKSVVPTGSRMGARECRTQAQWNAQSQKTQTDMDRRWVDAAR